MVVTKVSKAMAWIAIILLNLLFVYFSILKGYVKGLEWQVEIDFWSLFTANHICGVLTCVVRV